MNARLFSIRSPGRDWFSYTGPRYGANTGAVRTAAQEKQPIGFSFEALLVFFFPSTFLKNFLKTLLNSGEFKKKEVFQACERRRSPHAVALQELKFVSPAPCLQITFKEPDVCPKKLIC